MHSVVKRHPELEEEYQEWRCRYPTFTSEQDDSMIRRVVHHPGDLGHLPGGGGRPNLRACPSGSPVTWLKQNRLTSAEGHSHSRLLPTVGGFLTLLVWSSDSSGGDPGGQVMNQLTPAASSLPGYGTSALPWVGQIRRLSVRPTSSRWSHTGIVVMAELAPKVGHRSWFSQGFGGKAISRRSLRTWSFDSGRPGGCCSLNQPAYLPPGRGGPRPSRMGPRQV